MKEWTSPELIVLVRSKPEEAVLIGCKTDNIHGPTIAPVNDCLTNTPPLCQARTTSWHARRENCIQTFFVLDPHSDSFVLVLNLCQSIFSNITSGVLWRNGQSRNWQFWHGAKMRKASWMGARRPEPVPGPFCLIPNAWGNIFYAWCVQNPRLVNSISVSTHSFFFCDSAANKPHHHRSPVYGLPKGWYIVWRNEKV